jgi:hypothetical protein
MTIDFGDTVTGIVANENDWTNSGPRILRPRREVTGTVVGLFANSERAVTVKTPAGETVCVPGDASDSKTAPRK